MSLESPRSQIWSKRSFPGELSSVEGELKALALAQDDLLELSCFHPHSTGLFPPELGPAEPGRVLQDYQPEPRGSRRFRELLAQRENELRDQWWRRSDGCHSSELPSVRPVPAEQYLLFASTSEAFSQVLCLLADPGDFVLLPSPGYPLFEDLARLQGVRVEHYRWVYADGFVLDPQSLQGKEGARAVVVVSPHNPSGRWLRRSELEQLLKLGVPIIWDQVFAPYQLGSLAEDCAHPSLVAQAGQHCFGLDGLSKRAVAPGAKLGWCRVEGPDWTTAYGRLEHSSDAYLSVSRWAEEWGCELLMREAEAQALVLQRLRQNAQACARRLLGTALSVCPSEAGYGQLLRLPSFGQREFLERLAQRGVHLASGDPLGLEPGRFVLLSLLSQEKDLDRGLSHLIEVSREVWA